MMRFNLCYVCFLLLALPLLCSGQSSWSFGVSLDGGLSGRDQLSENHSPGTNTSFYYTEAYQNSLSMGGGVWVSYQLTPWLGLQTGLRYRNVGNEYSYHSQTYTEATDQMATNYFSGTELRIHQVQLPLLAEVSFPFGRVRPFFQIGGNFQKDIGFQMREESYDTRLGKTVASQNSVVQFDGNQGIHVEAALGVHLNERMAVSLRRTWAGFQTLIWSPDHEIINSTGGGVIICGNFSNRTTQSFHRQQLIFSLQCAL